MITFEFLNKQEKEDWLPALYDLFHYNMEKIVPVGWQREQWIAEISRALEKAPRQILLCFAGEELAGYVQYYIRHDLLVIEEVQLYAAYQRTTVFGRLCRHLLQILPAQIAVVEAFADAANHNSRRIMEKLGMVTVPDETPPQFVHLRGDVKTIRKFFRT